MRKNKDTQEDVRFQKETLDLFIGTITKIIQKVVKDELKEFKKHYTNEVLKPALDDLRADLEKKISSSIITTASDN